MKIGIVGAGKLGFPFALALDQAGHQVFIEDSSEQIRDLYERRLWPHAEKGVPELLAGHRIKWGLDDCQIVFVAVQTPHQKEYDGTTPLPDTRADFDYAPLAVAISIIDAPLVAVVSTVLPGTWKHLFTGVENYVYNPSFIAMGTVIDDLRNAEFNLIGSDRTDVRPLIALWRTINQAPNVETDITTAEAVKVAYNSFISMKIALANTWGWLGEKVGFDSDRVMDALTLADRRLISAAYLKPGMGDGGACHPRDLIALSWLAKEYGTFDLFGSLAKQREAHAEWLASMLPDGIVIFGRSFKPDVNIDTGSPALLVAHFLAEQGKTFTIGEDPTPGEYNFVATAHSRYREVRWPEGSTVWDPHGIIPDQSGVDVIRTGR